MINMLIKYIYGKIINIVINWGNANLHYHDYWFYIPYIVDKKGT